MSTRKSTPKRGGRGYMLRAIVSRTVLKQRGPTGRTYVSESLACGHTYETEATGAARTRAKQRECVACGKG